MDEDRRDKLVAEMLERPQERERILRDIELTDRERNELSSIVEMSDLLWLSAQGAPALAEDPTAAMLGLLPDSECTLSSGALSRARKRARLSISDLAARLRERGWEVAKSDVFRWETRTAADVPPAVVQSVADILGAPVDDLISPPSTTSLPEGIKAARLHPLFEQLVDRWARARRVSTAVAAGTLESRMLATVHRGEQPSTEQLLQSLDALVTSIEQGHRE